MPDLTVYPQSEFCLSDEELAKYDTGRLNFFMRLRAMIHLSHCLACQQALTEVQEVIAS